MPRPSRYDGDGRPSRAGADSRLSLLRELGEQAVLETIFRQGPITRPEIAAATNLSKPTVSAAVSRLEQEGLVRAAGRRAGQRGRNPVAYVVSSRAGFVVGGDIGGSNVRVAAADLFGEPICDLKRPTAKDGQPGRRRADPRDGQRGDRPGQRRPRPAAGARDLGARDRGSDERPGHLAGVQRGARGRLRSARGDPRPVRPAGARREQRQPRGGRREVVRSRQGRLDDGVHRDRRGDRHGDHHRRRARPRRTRRRGRNRLSAAGRRSVQPPAPVARRAGGRDRRGRDRRGVQRASRSGRS